MADPKIKLSGDIRVDDKGNWSSPQRVLSMIEVFGGGSNHGHEVSGGDGMSGGAGVKSPKMSFYKPPVKLPVR